MARQNEAQAVESGEAVISGESPEASEGEPTEAKVSKPKTSFGVMVTFPVAMKDILEKVAADGNTTIAAWARTTLAGAIDYTLPAAATRKGRQTEKYVGMSKEEKAKIQAEEQTAKRQKASALLAALEAGDLDIDLAMILEKYKPATRTRKTSDEAPAVEAASV